MADEDRHGPWSKADERYEDGCREDRPHVLDHDFLPVNGHPDDDECTHRADGTDLTYCGEPEAAHQVPAPLSAAEPWEHEGHHPVQHRDRKPPWCNECGWTSPVPAISAVQIAEVTR